MNDVVNLANKLDLFQDHWSPRIVAELNGQHVKLAKLQGEFLWHAHEDEDELFLVLKGALKIRMPGREVTVRPGEFFVVPRGVEHLPLAEEETHVLLFEPASTRHTGGAETERTVRNQPRI